jgi:hypothetical protein
VLAHVLVGEPDLRHQFGDIAGMFDGGSNDCKFVAPGPRNDVGCSDATAQAVGHGLQQFIADPVAERSVDALEFIDVDLERGQLSAAMDLSDLPSGCANRAHELADL